MATSHLSKIAYAKIRAMDSAKTAILALLKLLILAKILIEIPVFGCKMLTIS